MVSKSKILGQSSLILISVGSTKFPFFRLMSSLKKLNKNQYKILYEFIPPNQFVRLIKKTDKIIIHGGLGTIFLVIKYAKFMPLVIPRLTKYKEHVDNHQLFFTKYLKSRLPENLKKYFVIEEKIDKAIENYLGEQNKSNELSNYLFLTKNRGDLIKNLDSYINIK